MTPISTTLLGSGAIVASVPRPIIGGLLIFLGLTFLVEWLLDGWRELVRSDYLVAC